MLVFIRKRQSFLILIISINILIGTRIISGQEENIQARPWKKEASAPIWIHQLIWGQMQGLGADFSLLKSFSLFYEAKKQPFDQSAWKAFSRSLFIAQKMDPLFRDVYHFGILTLTYDAKMPAQGVALAKLGGEANPNYWEPLFLGGFVAYDILKNFPLATELMSKAASVDNAPTLVISLAARFMKKTAGKEASITFLQKMATSLPSGYRKAIEQRIKELSMEEGHDKKP